MVTRYYRELLAFCIRVVRDRDAAADAVQESYARFLSIEQSSVPVLEPRALLFQTARRVMVDQYRRGKLRLHEDLATLAEAEQPRLPAQQQPEAILAGKQAVEAYVAAIAGLPPRCREVFILHVFDNLSHAQIAECLGMTVSMVEKHVARGRLTCRACEREIQGLPAQPGAESKGRQKT
ncbi:sigma-70 family RNA polymerase sigma factor [Pseudothauera nasutitermitis]|uniref:Sigma-70 family RNA polymerase sigma factor n=1 Tax=Pseudothauera nasutitermitis TaxID=2565930 RepID=A0A4S4B3V1_9RHOO|nr:sigma-70 family RNA polymerase sigma factor [Pseudothauera nasutitermitis]THF67368.1 sigma-70 family RNA polymerase sigma factor [Pseudothauera nasutitermitis]